MKVLYVSTSEAGYAKEVEVADGMTVQGFFEAFVGGDPKNYKIRVDSRPTVADQVLTSGQRITVTPTKVDGGF